MPNNGGEEGYARTWWPEEYTNAHHRAHSKLMMMSEHGALRLKSSAPLIESINGTNIGPHFKAG